MSSEVDTSKLTFEQLKKIRLLQFRLIVPFEMKRQKIFLFI